jgi:hypothetical protein
MTLQPIPSKYPYIIGKLDCLLSVQPLSRQQSGEKGAPPFPLYYSSLSSASMYSKYHHACQYLLGGDRGVEVDPNHTTAKSPGTLSLF